LLYKLLIAAIGLLLFACDGLNPPSEKPAKLVASEKFKQSVVVAPMLSGYVDSSLIDRNAQNRVYVYSGMINEPFAVAAVEQTPGTCQWHYVIKQLPVGDYRLVFANRPQQALQSHTLKIQDTPVVINFNAAHVIKVGPERDIKSPSEAARRANSGDVIEIDVGNYPNDVAVWHQDKITLRGLIGVEKVRPHIHMTRPIAYTQGSDQANGKGIWVIKGNNISIENIELSGAKVAHENGAGIRIDKAMNTTICNSYFHHNENGLLGGGGTLLVEYSEFEQNGSGSGYTHNIYVNQAETSLIFQYNYSHGVRVGHNLKTRAKINYILYNRIMDQKVGNSSYLVDVSNGGLTYIIGNVLQQSRKTVNKTTAIAYGLEGIKAGYPAKLFFINNTLVNNLESGYFLKIATNAQVSLFNNLLLGGGTMANRTFDQSYNLQSSVQELVDADGFNYHLKPGSKAIDAGTSVDKGQQFELTPKYEYVHPSSMKNRITYGDSIDIGAYEYNP